ncbi:hypothetical protein I6I57_09600 [Brevibacterium casei]|uniref:Eco57I restriction-modification methylase domain-containing protein n=1 Tax=Brevibacterium casei TaxID=33889 RepID=UPI001918F94E|nr:hypothetical protein [Brevibacterium casei]QQT68045.1 hypothetical protein I6I57_09600 [Brevibacterium casei]
MKDEYPTGKADLMTGFMIKAQALTSPGGTWAMINLPSWMSLKSFEDLRQNLLRNQRLVSMVHLGRGVFGSDFGSVAFVMANAKGDGGRAVYRRLFEQHVDVRSVATIEALFFDRDYNRFEVAQSDFAAIPGSPIVYWLSEKMRSAFKVGKPLGQLADLLVGLRTGDNGRFMRHWWEVSRARLALGCASLEDAKVSRRRWFPYNKGGAFRKWYGNQEHVVNWENDGREVEEGLAKRYPYMVPKGKTLVRGQGRDRYFSPSVSWSKVSSGSPAFRAYPVGFIFDVAGTSIFAANSRSHLWLLGFANSQMALEQLAAVAPTLNYEVGQVAGLPVVDADPDQVVRLASSAVATAKHDWDSFETSWEFQGSPIVELLRGS